MLSLVTYLQRDSVLRGLTTNLPIREAAASIFPAVLTTQGTSIVFCCIALCLHKRVSLEKNATGALLDILSSQRSSLSSEWYYYGWSRLEVLNGCHVGCQFYLRRDDSPVFQTRHCQFGEDLVGSSRFHGDTSCNWHLAIQQQDWRLACPQGEQSRNIAYNRIRLDETCIQRV